MAQVIIPDNIRKRYPEIVTLIEGSESMNDEERQYWINILPIMTPEQIENLKGILLNEKEQLKAIDEKYSKEVQKIGTDELVRKTESKRKKQISKRKAKEQAAEEEEDQAMEDVLSQIESL